MKRSGNIYFGFLITLMAVSFAAFTLVKIKTTSIPLLCVFLAISAVLLIIGLFEIIRWLLDARVRKYGEKSFATVKKVPDISGGTGLIQTGKTVQIDFEYKNADGKLLKGSSVIIADLAKSIAEDGCLPILLYKNRAVIDYKALKESK